MSLRIAVALLLLCISGPIAVGSPLDPALQQQLLALYDRYGKLMIAGNLTEAATLRTADARAELLATARRPAREQTELKQMARLMTPDQVTPLHGRLNAGGDAATILVLGTKTWPSGLRLPNAPKPGTVTHGEVTLEFAQEGKEWKLRDQTFGPDPSSIAACHDDPVEAPATYNRSANSSAGGVIRRVEFKPDHTLVVIRIVDEENCLILPPRDWLASHDGHPDKLVPWAMIEVEGAPHRQDKRRFLADRWTVTDEE